jgi:hypothetical protein
MTSITDVCDEKVKFGAGRFSLHSSVLSGGAGEFGKGALKAEPTHNTHHFPS